MKKLWKRLINALLRGRLTVLSYTLQVVATIIIFLFLILLVIAIVLITIIKELHKAINAHGDTDVFVSTASWPED